MAFRHISEVCNETEKYIDDRRKGLIKSCKTGYKKLDGALLGGIEYGSTISIGARPGVGKTAISSALLRGIIKNNDISNLEILDFNWEMSSKSLMIRDLSAEMKETYKNIISAGNNPVSDEDFKKYQNILEQYKNLPWNFEEDPKTTAEFESIVTNRIAKNPNKKRIVRIDHSVLAKQSASEANQVVMLQNLLAVCVKLKKQSDIIFIILTQIGRDFETRQEDGSDNAFPRLNDCYGSDSVSQSSEVVILLNRPSLYGVSYYGRRPNGISIDSNTVFAHIVKSRNSESNLTLQYEAQFDKMRIREI